MQCPIGNSSFATSSSVAIPMIVSGLASTGTRHPDLVGVRRVGEFASGLTVSPQMDIATSNALRPDP